MANRHLSRSIILQTLFEWDFKAKPEGGILEMLERNAEEFAPGLDDFDFMKAMTESVVKNQTIIDQVIEKAAPEWPLEKINAVDRNILRIGLAELLFGDHVAVPPKVSINEAIELAKTFGGDSSSRFVNGVLGAVYKEIGEPGKEQKSKRQMKDEPVDVSTLPVEHKAGALVYAEHDGEVYLAFVHDVFGYWTLSKGGVEETDASLEAAAAREVKAEIGITVDIKEKLGEDEYIASHPEKGKIRKQVTFFLAQAKYQPLKLESSGGLDEAAWFTLANVTKLRMYDSVTALIAKAVPIITGKK